MIRLRMINVLLWLAIVNVVSPQLLRPEVMNLGHYNEETKHYEKTQPAELQRPNEGSEQVNGHATTDQLSPLLGGDDHDKKPHGQRVLGGDDHDKRPHQTLFGSGDHDMVPHTQRLLGADGHDMLAAVHHSPVLGGDDHDRVPPHRTILGGDGHDQKPHTQNLRGADGHDNVPDHRPIFGGDDHDRVPHHRATFGNDVRDYVSHHNSLVNNVHQGLNHHHTVLGGDGHDKKPHTPRLFGSDGHDSAPHRRPILGGDDHDKVPHQRRTLIGGDDHDRIPHRRPVLGGDDHDKVPHHRRILIGGDDHDRIPHHRSIFGGDDHDRVPHHGSILLTFQSFMRDHARQYGTPAEFRRRFSIFRQNLQRIKQLRRSEQASATYGVTKFADLTVEEFSKLLGFRPELRRPSERRLVVGAQEPQAQLPDTYDWRHFNVVTPVKNQGMCGSCWAFSTTGNVEGQWALKHNQLLSLSEQELVDCDKEDHGCEGGLPENAYDAIEKLGGLETEDQYPYNGHDGTCHMEQAKAKAQVNGSLELPTDESEIAQWLYKNGPISIGLNANPLQFYTGGVSHPLRFLCDPKGINHGVLIVGYGTHVTKYLHRVQPYWLVKNSWGPGWGEQGYFRMYRGDGTCGLNLMATSAIVL